MAFLLDTNVCSEHLKRPRGLMHRFMQHSGGLFIPTIVLGELYTWAYLRPDPLGLIARLENELLLDLKIIEFDKASAEVFGKTRAGLLKKGLDVSRIDLMIGSMALAHDKTLVTHNTADFRNIPNLRIVDWLAH
jgi:tRNA(fMet)-specific endonuclease VapC